MTFIHGARVTKRRTPAGRGKSGQLSSPGKLKVDIIAIVIG